MTKEKQIIQEHLQHQYDIIKENEIDVQEVEEELIETKKEIIKCNK